MKIKKLSCCLILWLIVAPTLPAHSQDIGRFTLDGPCELDFIGTDTGTRGWGSDRADYALGTGEISCVGSGRSIVNLTVWAKLRHNPVESEIKTGTTTTDHNACPEPSDSRCRTGRLLAETTGGHAGENCFDVKVTGSSTMGDIGGDEGTVYVEGPYTDKLCAP